MEIEDLLNDALFAFVVPDVDADGAYLYDDDGKLKTHLPTSFEEIELIFTPNGLLTFNLKFGGTLVDGELPIETLEEPNVALLRKPYYIDELLEAIERLRRKSKGS